MARRGFSVKVEGLRDLEKALGDLPKANAKRVLTKTLKEAGEPVARTARALAPKDKLHLSEGIDVTTKLSPRQRRLNKKESPVEMYIGPGPDPAAHLDEFGTGDRITEDGRNLGSMPAQPFMRPAWDQHKMGVLDTIANRTWWEIEQAARRLAKKAAKGR
ncbi:HK97-gp10 family putative phage morphogenesis protein [Shinella sp. BYT-45]|uniref:HK97-gp10 family putative phage morphogenesis protein n=1 Tax=Shinella sp. BYT-45 TaxID=3377377 RepID=UPI0039806C14